MAQAAAHRLGEESGSWGSYYAQQPQVYVGNIGLGHTALARAGVFERLGLPVLNQESGHAA